MFESRWAPISVTSWKLVVYEPRGSAFRNRRGRVPGPRTSQALISYVGVFDRSQLELPAENWKRQQQSLSRGSDRVDHFVIQEFHGERSPRTRQRGDRGCIVDDKHFSAVRAELLRQS